MIGYPLDSHVEYDSNGTPIYDRAITSAPLRKLYKSLFSDGVMPNPSTNMQVSAGDGMNVIIQPGFAMCNGCLKLEETQRTLAVQASSSAYDRIDTVVLRLNDNDSERICDFYILEGTPATSPVRPTLTRTESIWELGLADLFIAKNSTIVSNQRITDTRYETERCGVISSISQFDTDTLYQQIQTDLAGFKSEEQADFLTWFEEIKNQLSEDAAGNLQNQIGSLPSLVTEIKDSLVSAINWIVDKLSLLASKIGESDISEIGDGTVTGAIASQNETLTNINTDLTALNGRHYGYGVTSYVEYNALASGVAGILVASNIINNGYIQTFENSGAICFKRKGLYLLTYQLTRSERGAIDQIWVQRSLDGGVTYGDTYSLNMNENDHTINLTIPVYINEGYAGLVRMRIYAKTHNSTGILDGGTQVIYLGY